MTDIEKALKEIDERILKIKNMNMGVSCIDTRPYYIEAMQEAKLIFIRILCPENQEKGKESA